METIYKITKDIIGSWQKPTGLILSILLLLVLQYYILLDVFSDLGITFNVVVSILYCLLISIIWVFTTNRFFVRGNSEMLVLISVTTDGDDKKIDTSVKNIINQTIEVIEDDVSKKHLKIKLLPLNYLRTEKKTKRFLNNYQNYFDTLIEIKLASGKFDSIEKMKISKMKAIGHFNHQDREKQMFFDSVDFRRDLSLVNYHKKWDFIFENDGNDKIKWRRDLRETILHYCGIYALYLDKYKLSLRFIEAIFDERERILKVPDKQNPGKSRKIQLSNNAVVAGRLASILLNLYVAVGFKHFDNQDLVKALAVLKKCEALGIQKYMNPIYILMARLYYELDDLKKAKEYTKKAQKNNPHDRSVQLNYLWFAAIENNLGRFCQIHLKLIKKGPVKDQNYVEISEFIKRHKDKYPESVVLLDFMLAYSTYAYSPTEGLREIIKIKEDCNSQHECVKHLADKVISIEQRRKKN